MRTKMIEARTELTEDQTDRRPKWMCTSVLDVHFGRGTEVTEDRSDWDRTFPTNKIFFLFVGNRPRQIKKVYSSEVVPDE